MTTIAPTITPQEAATRPWDAIVIGAGPAGGMCSLLLARRGWNVLLVEKSPFPREKVCGCCFGAAGVALLSANGLSRILDDAIPLQQVEIRRRTHRLRLPLTGGCALTRSDLDSRIVSAAISAGASFLPRCSARLGPVAPHWRDLHLHQDQHASTIRARLILACDGIRGTLLDAEPSCQWRIARDSWMGAAMTLNLPLIPPGRIIMHAGDGGYVGGVALPDGRSHLAAAFDPAAAKSAGGPYNLMTRILHDCGTSIDDDHAAEVSGTPLLTRRRRQYGAHRVLAVGDACAYIEPFTGEGMTWAIQSADLLARFLPSSLETWPADLPGRWKSALHAALGHEQLVCRALRYVLHRPLLASAAIRFAGRLPEIGDAIVRMISGSAKREVPA